jgi:hypothetical protein
MRPKKNLFRSLQVAGGFSGCTFHRGLANFRHGIENAFQLRLFFFFFWSPSITKGTTGRSAVTKVERLRRSRRGYIGVEISPRFVSPGKLAVVRCCFPCQCGDMTLSTLPLDFPLNRGRELIEISIPACGSAPGAFPVSTVPGRDRAPLHSLSDELKRATNHFKTRRKHFENAVKCFKTPQKCFKVPRALTSSNGLQ